MNLVDIIKKEISEKKINSNDKEKIKDLIYEKSGQYFMYDPKWWFCTAEERENIKNKRFDVHNISDFYATCYSWSYACKDLLNEFNIPARVRIIYDKNGIEHAYVEAYINGETFLMDLMSRFEDVVRIKIGLSTINNVQITNNHKHQKWKHEEIDNALKTEDILKTIKEKLNSFNVDYEEYVYRVFKTIECIMNVPRYNFSYVEGIRTICMLLKEFIGEQYHPANTHFVNNQKNIYIEVYTLQLNGENRFFAYQQMENGFFELHEKSEEEIRELETICDYIQGYSLNLKKSYKNI